MDWQNAIFAPGWVWSMLSMVSVVGSLAGVFRAPLGRTRCVALDTTYTGRRRIR